MNNYIFAHASSAKREGDMRRNIRIRLEELGKRPAKPQIKPKGLFGTDTLSVGQSHKAGDKNG